jgi:ribosome-binding protein aMBF1 (putative translation factor)
MCGRPRQLAYIFMVEPAILNECSSCHKRRENVKYRDDKEHLRLWGSTKIRLLCEECVSK